MNKQTAWVHLPQEIYQYLFTKSDFQEGEKISEKAWPSQINGNIVNFHLELTRKVINIPEETLQTDLEKSQELLENLAKLSAESLHSLLTPEIKQTNTFDLYVDIPLENPENGIKYVFQKLGYSFRIRLYFKNQICYSMRVIIASLTKEIGRKAKDWYFSSQSEFCDKPLTDQAWEEGFRSEIIYQQRADSDEKENKQLSYFWDKFIKRLTDSNAIVIGTVKKNRRFWSILEWGMEENNPLSKEKIYEDEAPILLMIDAWGRVVNDLCYLYTDKELELSSIVDKVNVTNTFEEISNFASNYKWDRAITLLQQELETSYHKKALKQILTASDLIYKNLEANNVKTEIAKFRKYQYLNSES